MNGPGGGGEVPAADCYQTVVMRSATLLRSVHAPGTPDILQITFMCPVGEGKEDRWGATVARRGVCRSKRERLSVYWLDSGMTVRMYRTV